MHDEADKAKEILRTLTLSGRAHFLECNVDDSNRFCGHHSYDLRGKVSACRANLKSLEELCTFKVGSLALKESKRTTSNSGSKVPEAATASRTPSIDNLI